jgi:two-component system, sensor histidine kinase RegB
MTDLPGPSPFVPPHEIEGGRVSARTLIAIRWFAVFGQGLTVPLVGGAMGYALPVGPALAAVAVSIIVNLYAGRRVARQPFLGDRPATLYLTYDMLQLSLLLSLTGGIENPFVVLLLAPLTVAASTMGRQSVIQISCLAITCFTLLALAFLPLPWKDGEVGLPAVYRLGIWAALTLSAIFLSVYLYQVAQGQRRLSAAYAASKLSLARAQRASAVGALAAAAAHELGSPLGTIAVVAKELGREVPRDSAIGEDIALLQSQVARCRDILANLSRSPGSTSDARPPVPLAALVETAAAPYRRAGVLFEIVRGREPAGGGPPVQETPEVLHGLGNILQNAMQFASTRVTARIDWDLPALKLTVSDDGPGFPPHLQGRLGEPYVSGRPAAAREADGNMGLGLFIAATLLERSGASISYENGRAGGARVVLHWKKPDFTL